MNEAAQDQRKQIQDQRANRERDQQHNSLVGRARVLLSNLQYDDCIEVLSAARQQYPGDHEILKLLDTARREQVRLKEKQDLLKQRTREVERMIERQELTEAIDLARQTITTVGPDIGLADTLTKAERELEFREQKKRDQDEKLRAARVLLDDGKFNDLAVLLREALEAHLFEIQDARVEKLFEEIDTKIRQRPLPPSDTRTGDLAKDYVFLQRTRAPESPAQLDPSAASAAAPRGTGSGAGALPSASCSPSNSGVPSLGSTFARSEAKEESIVLGLTNSSSSPAMPKVLPTDQAPPAAHSGWQDRNSQFIVAVEKHLAAFLGPIAGIVTRRAASQAKDPAELFTLLAAMLHTERDRSAFQELSRSKRLPRKDQLSRRLHNPRRLARARS